MKLEEGLSLATALTDSKAFQTAKTLDLAILTATKRALSFTLRELSPGVALYKCWLR